MITLATLNTLDQDAFTHALGFAFEGEPWVQRAAWQHRPFTDAAALHAACVRVIAMATPEQQLALLCAHPDLAGKAALAGELTVESTAEQASAGLSALSAEEYTEFHRLNSAYQARFGFPFIICVREHTKKSILAAFGQRLNHTVDAERITALSEVGKIGWLRLRDALEAT